MVRLIPKNDSTQAPEDFMEFPGAPQHDGPIPRVMRSYGRRVFVLKNMGGTRTPKRPNDGVIQGQTESNLLAKLPQEILVEILSKLKHGDLKNILLVAKFITQAALVARKTHFLYSTPSTKPAFNWGLDLSDSDVIREVMNAPLQQRVRISRLNGKRISSIRTALFTSPKKRAWTPY